jgi:hypothetical protein
MGSQIQSHKQLHIHHDGYSFHSFTALVAVTAIVHAHDESAQAVAKDSSIPTMLAPLSPSAPTS